MSKTKLNIGPYRCVYPMLSQPKSFVKDDPKSAKYGIKILIPKADKAGQKKVLDFINASIDEIGAWKAPIKSQVKGIAKDFQNGMNDNCILKDGDMINDRREAEGKERNPAYDGNYVVSFGRKASFGAPLVVDRDASPIPPAFIDSKITGGYHVNVSASAYAYEKPKFGITLQLQAVQFVKTDEVFGQANPFEAIEGAEVESDGEPFNDQF